MPDIPERLASALSDRYRIERELGQGGMATVYLAQDLKHDRHVALKVLKPELAAVLGAERFVVEIKTTAALQHPHILPLFDSGTADGFLYYVMPYIEGETLRTRLDRETQLGITEAVKITSEVADALDYAHRHGVIHRDIKPENILLHDGRPMVADFGIALALSAAAGGRMTETGLSLGTPHYMSPEQATAEKELSNRSDIYSLGCVLYEMLTGNPPHTGATAQQIIMKIVTEEAAPVTKLRKSVPPNVAAAVGKAVERLPADRFESARDFASALSDANFTTSDDTAASGAAGTSRRAPLALAGWVAAALLAIALGWKVFRAAPAKAADSIRFAFSPGGTLGSRIEVEISPDGQRILLPEVVGKGGVTGVAVHDLGSLETRMLTLPAQRPRISPDGRWLAYRDDGRLRKVPVEGGPPTTVSNDCGDSLDWLDAESLVCTTNSWGLGRVSSAGGKLEVLAVPDTIAGEIGLWSVSALPGGRAVVYTSYRRPAARIEALDLRTRTRHVLVENAVMARYARSGHLLFVRDNALFAVRFDVRALRTLGTAVPVLEDVATRPFDAMAGFAIADNGTLAVVRQSEWTAPRRMVWVDREGAEQPAIRVPGEYSFPRIASDQSRLLLTVATAGRRDLWIYDVRRTLLTQLTRSTTGSAFRGVWTPDGRQVFFTNETPSYDVYRVPADGSAPPVAVASSQRDKYADAVSPDGKFFLGDEEWSGVRRVMLTSLDGSGPNRPISDSTLLSFHPSLSPDGRWVAYSEGGEVSLRRIVVRRTDGTGAKLQVSAGGDYDVLPRWTRGGHEIVFRRRSAVYGVDVDVATGQIGMEHKLFDGPYPVELGYDVTPDGSRFLMVRVEPRPEALPILVITNFFEELRKKAGP